MMKEITRLGFSSFLPLPACLLRLLRDYSGESHSNGESTLKVRYTIETIFSGLGFHLDLLGSSVGIAGTDIMHCLDEYHKSYMKGV